MFHRKKNYDLRVFVTGSNLTEAGNTDTLQRCTLFSFCDKVALAFNKARSIMKKNFVIEVVLDN